MRPASRPKGLENHITPRRKITSANPPRRDAGEPKLTRTSDRKKAITRLNATGSGKRTSGLAAFAFANTIDNPSSIPKVEKLNKKIYPNTINDTPERSFQ